MSLIQLIDQIKKADSINKILDYYPNPQMQGYVYERLWDLIIKFGFCPIFHKMTHLIGNSNTWNLKELKSLRWYIENNIIISGNSGGSSDITMLNKNDNKYIFISSKYSKIDYKSKTVSHYDIQNIVAMANNNNIDNFEIYLLVPNKKEVMKTVNASNKSSKYIITPHSKCTDK